MSQSFSMLNQPQGSHDQYIVGALKFRNRTTISGTNLLILKSFFEKQHFITASQKEELAKRTGMTQRTIKNWFKNQRQLLKKKQDPLNSDHL